MKLISVIAVLLVAVSTNAQTHPVASPAAPSPPAQSPKPPVQSPPAQQSPYSPPPQQSPQQQPPKPSPQASPQGNNAPVFSTGTSAAVDVMSCNRPDVLALTFDDGPDGPTSALLDTLKSLNVKATFFLIGNKIGGNPGVVKRAFDEGHQIASHTWSHPHLPTLNQGAVLSELQQTDAAIKNVIGFTPSIMRPPYGDSVDATLQAIHQNGQTAVVWNLDTNDWAGVDPYLGFNQFLNPGSTHGYISLQHDTQQHSVNDAKIRSIINIANQRNIKLITIADCIGKQPYKEGWGNLSPNGTAAVTTTLATTTVATTVAPVTVAPVTVTPSVSIQQGKNSGAVITRGNIIFAILGCLGISAFLL